MPPSVLESLFEPLVGHSLNNNNQNLYRPDANRGNQEVFIHRESALPIFLRSRIDTLLASFSRIIRMILQNYYTHAKLCEVNTTPSIFRFCELSPGQTAFTYIQT